MKTGSKSRHRMADIDLAPEEEEDLSPPPSQPDNSSDSEPPPYSPTCFRYTHKVFGHSSLPPFPINRTQFGHKRLAFHFRKASETTRSIVRSLPHEHTNLLDAPKARNSRRGSALRWGLVVFIVGCAAIGAAINFFHTPQTELRQIKSAASIVSERVSTLGQLLQRPEITKALLFTAFEEVGSLLNQSGVVELTIEAIVNEGIVPKVWQFLKNEAGECESRGSQVLIVYGVSLFQDIAVSGGPISVNAQAVGKIFERCYEIDDVVTAVSQFLAVVAQVKGIGLGNAAKLIVNVLVKEEFGPWVLPPFRFFAIWSRSRKLSETDAKTACEFLAYMVKHGYRWKREHYGIMCVLAEGVKCPCMETEEGQKLYANGDCKESSSL
jgi:hypothetical protein